MADVYEQQFGCGAPGVRRSRCPGTTQRRGPGDDPTTAAARHTPGRGCSHRATPQPNASPRPNTGRVQPSVRRASRSRQNPTPTPVSSSCRLLGAARNLRHR